MNLPPYKIFPIITGPTISLRQIVTADIKDLVEISFYDAVQAITEQQAIEMQTKINKDYFDGNTIHWGIADRLTSKIVGTCGYYRGFGKGEGELGCILLPRYRGQGYMTSAMLFAIDFGLNTIGLNRIYALTSQQNKEAVRLLERLKFLRVAESDSDEIAYQFRLQER